MNEIYNVRLPHQRHKWQNDNSSVVTNRLGVSFIITPLPSPSSCVSVYVDLSLIEKIANIEMLWNFCCKP